MGLILFFNILFITNPRKNIGLMLLHIGRSIFPNVFEITLALVKLAFVFAPIGYPQNNPKNNMVNTDFFDDTLFEFIIAFSRRPDISINGSNRGRMLLYQSIKPLLAPDIKT